MYKSHKIGKQGEKVAESYLIKNGYKILDKNFYSIKGEIDIIALDKKQIVFIEIKSRTSLKYGLPSEAVTRKKLQSMYKTAEYYVHIRNLSEENIRFDAIEVYIKNNKEYINHIKQII